MVEHTRVLLLCPEPLGHQQPAGVGIRFIEFARALRSAGHAVTVLSPDGGTVEGCSSGVASPENIRDHSLTNDVAVLQGHIINEFVAHAGDIPLVVDLYDPYIVENLHYSTGGGDEVFQHDRITLMKSLLAGDFFLCASRGQRLFYLGLLLSAGRFTPQSFHNDPTLNSLLDIVPFGVPPPRKRSPNRGGSMRLLFGGIYDWYDPILAIEAVSIARRRLPELTLTFTRHPNPELTPQGMAARAIEHVKKHRLDFVHFDAWTPYETRGAYYDGFVAALLTFPQSVETELSMRTRVFDYLWAELPVITSSAPGTDEILNDYKAGTVVFSNSPEDFADVIIDLLTNEPVYARFVQGAGEFVTHHQWPQLIEPLLRFCMHPARDQNKPARRVVREMTGSGRGVLTRLRKRMGGRI